MTTSEELLHRLATETPIWFKKIKAFAVLVGVIAGAVEAILVSMPQIQVHPSVHVILIALAGIATGSFGTASTASTTPPKTDEQK